MADIALLTEKRYLNPIENSPYVANLLKEDQILKMELEKLGLKVIRKAWDEETPNPEKSTFTLFRTTWNYFDYFDRFVAWLDEVKSTTTFINPLDLVHWNFNKYYLLELGEQGLEIPPTMWIEEGSTMPLASYCKLSGWQEFVIKPAVSGAARLTYRFHLNEISGLEASFQEWIKKESFLLQQYLPAVQEEGEVSLMYMGGVFTHAIRKKAKPGDFRVQDDFGGTVHDHLASDEEIKFGYMALEACPVAPVYARVDLIRNHRQEPCLSELELIEPELWFRFHPPAAEKLAHSIVRLF